MRTVDILDAETDPSLVEAMDAVASGAESAVIIARNGKSAVKIMPLATDAPRRGGAIIGIAKGKFKLPDDFDELDAEIEVLFNDGPAFPPE